MIALRNIGLGRDRGRRVERLFGFQHHVHAEGSIRRPEHSRTYHSSSLRCVYVNPGSQHSHWFLARRKTSMIDVSQTRVGNSPGCRKDPHGQHNFGAHCDVSPLNRRGSWYSDFPVLQLLPETASRIRLHRWCVNPNSSGEPSACYDEGTTDGVLR